MGTKTRRTEAEVRRAREQGKVHSFQASPELSANLQRVLVDLIELHLQGKQAHWNVVGTNFRDLHLQLDELVDFAREASDTIAERMRALDAHRYIPFSTARELAERIPGATLTRLAGGDHYIMEERPDEVTAALLDLLARPCVAAREASEQLD